MARGILAEFQHQAKVAAREAERKKNVAVREQAAAARRAEQARKAAERALAQASRAAEADRKRMEKEAKAAHVAEMEAQVEELNAGLAAAYDEIDSLLAWTVELDDFVDLDSLRREVNHPAFDRGDLEVPVPPAAPIPDPAEPVYQAPPPPKGFLGKKKKQAESIAVAETAYRSAHDDWERAVAALPARRKAISEARDDAEAKRIAALSAERARYEAECAARDTEVVEHNAAIDKLIADLAYGAVDAVQEYVGIVLSNSLYPERFEVQHEFAFEPSTAELSLKVMIPDPAGVPTIKAYKYTKSADEITTTALSKKASKDRYGDATHQVALRSLHEVFEADRRGVVKTISLEVGTETTDPATGNRIYVPFVAVAAEREKFLAFDLSSLVPEATLEHLGGAVSKNPFELVAADTSGVRRS